MSDNIPKNIHQPKSGKAVTLIIGLIFAVTALFVFMWVMDIINDENTLTENTTVENASLVNEYEYAEAVSASYSARPLSCRVGRTSIEAETNPYP